LINGAYHLTSDQLTWEGVEFSARYGLLYDATTERILRLVDFGSTKQAGAGMFIVKPTASGWMAIG
jgi:hypothetical protein